VRQGQPASVPITVTRSRTPGSDIHVIVTGAPEGIEAASFTIPSGENTGYLPIKIGALSQGDVSGAVSLQGSAGSTATANVALHLSVSGNRGSLDLTFGTDGSGVIEDPTEYSYIQTVAPQSNGTILIGALGAVPAGSTKGTTSAVIRLKADGTVDSTLTNTPIQKISGTLFGVTSYPDGRIVTTTEGYNISRYTANGALDTTFNSPAGTIQMSTFFKNLNDYRVFPTAIAVAADGSIYAGVNFLPVTTPGAATASYWYAFFQIGADGQRNFVDAESNFVGCTGSWASDKFSWNFLTHMFLLPTAGAVAFAGVGQTPSSQVAIGRYSSLSTCTLDDQYGGIAGTVGTEGTKGISYFTDWAYLDDAFLESDGSIAFLARTVDGNTTYSLVHVDPTGTQTKSVKSLAYDGSRLSGKDRTDNSNIVTFVTGGVTRAPDGRYLVAGENTPAGNTSMAIAYYTSDLTPDPTIGTKGVITIPTKIASTTGIGLRAVYTPDGSRTIVVGVEHGTRAATDSANNPITVPTEHLVVARIWN
jgi:uncharacterized delta-60 repeat protein